MTLAENKRLRLFTLCVLYVAQGIPWGFTATTVPAYLSSHGLSQEAVSSVLVMTTLPYSFKWILGPIVDTFTGSRFGRRRPWIIFAQAAMAATILAMIAVRDFSADLELLVWMVFVHTCFNALQDTSVDALAIDLLDEDERGRANGLMYAAKYGGGAIGGAGLSWVIAWSSFETALIVTVALLGAIMFVPLLVRERDDRLPRAEITGSAWDRVKATFAQAGNVGRSLAIVFSVRSAVVAAVLMLGLNLGIGILSANGFTLFTQQLGWSAESYTSLVGGVGLIAGLGGSVAGGFLSDRFGRRRVIATAACVMAAGWLTFGTLTSLWPNDGFVYAMALVEAACQGIMTVGTFALCMDVSWSVTGGSQFTAYMAMANFSTTLGYKLAPVLTAKYGYASCYLIAAAIQVSVVLLLLAIDPKQTRRTLPLPAGTPTPVRGIIAVSMLLVVLVGLTYYVTRGKF